MKNIDYFVPRGRPQYRPVVIIIITQVVCPSVRPCQLFKIKPKSLGLVERIIDDSCLVYLFNDLRGVVDVRKYIRPSVLLFIHSAKLKYAIKPKTGFA